LIALQVVPGMTAGLRPRSRALQM